MPVDCSELCGSALLIGVESVPCGRSACKGHLVALVALHVVQRCQAVAGEPVAPVLCRDRVPEGDKRDCMLFNQPGWSNLCMHLSVVKNTSGSCARGFGMSKEALPGAKPGSDLPIPLLGWTVPSGHQA